MITGRTEPIAAMVMFYLCLAPCGRRFSLDRFLATARRGLAAIGRTKPRIKLIDVRHDRHAADSNPPGAADRDDGLFEAAGRDLVERRRACGG